MLAAVTISMRTRSVGKSCFPLPDFAVGLDYKEEVSGHLRRKVKRSSAIAGAQALRLERIEG